MPLPTERKGSLFIGMKIKDKRQKIKDKSKNAK
jgi:hypothetical protein